MIYFYIIVLLLQLGKADTVSHKFRRKSKVKETKSEETISAHNMSCPSFSSSSSAICEDYCLNTLQDREDKELSTFSLNSELLDSESLTELPLVEKLANCSLSTPKPSLFADNMEIFHPPQATAASVASEISLASSLLEDTTEHMYSDVVEVCNNETVSVSSYKIWKEDCLLIVWLVSNKSGSELKSANLEIAPAENFQVRQ